MRACDFFRLGCFTRGQRASNSEWIFGAARMKGIASVVLALSLPACSTLASEPAYCDSARAAAAARMASLSDWDVAWIGTALSQQGYEGECPCPTSTAVDGSRCGARSAYSKGARLACTPDDIPRADLPTIRSIASRMASPIECGGMASESIRTWPSTPVELLPDEWR